MVNQQTCLFKNDFRFSNAVDLNKCLNQTELYLFHSKVHTCAAISNLPSNISTMVPTRTMDTPMYNDNKVNFASQHLIGQYRPLIRPMAGQQRCTAMKRVTIRFLFFNE